MCIDVGIKYTWAWDYDPCSKLTITTDLFIQVNGGSPPQGQIIPTPGNACRVYAKWSDADGTPPQAMLVNPSGNGVIKTWRQADNNHANSAVDVSAYSGQTISLSVPDVLPNGFVGTAQTVDSYTVPACPAGLSCGTASATPGTPEPGQNFIVSATFNYSGGSPPGGNPDRQMVLSGPDGTHTFTTADLTYSTTANTITIQTKPPGLSVSKAGDYTVTWQLANGATVINCPPVAATIPVGYKPYLQVYGGDVVTGGGIPAATTPANGAVACGAANPDNPLASIVGWNQEDKGASPNFWQGAGSRYAAQAPNEIFDFASSLGNIGTPISLSFANTNASATKSGGQYGGSFGSVPPCNLTPVSGGQSPSAANPALPSTINGTVTMYVNGNVYINHNITYATGPRNSVSDIPSFKLVALGGNIYIDPGVTQLDGMYYALPDGGSGGVISTCATASGHEYWNDSANATTCNNQLVVNGALVANKVHFLRSCGTLSQSAGDQDITTTSGACTATNHAAEVVNYSPEVWMVPSGGNSTLKYDSITSLPPVL